ncbi:hypothetical protein PQR66_38260, partial [Paraburkholderia agricolaris]
MGFALRGCLGGRGIVIGFGSVVCGVVFYSVVRDADFFGFFLPLVVVLVSVVCLWHWDLPVLVFWPFLAVLVVCSVVGLLAFPCIV